MLLCLCVVMLAGCGAADKALPAAAKDGQETDGYLSYAPSDFFEKETARRGGTLHASTATDTGSLDIHAISHGNVQWMGRIMFDCLVYQDEKGGISPWLATSWEISPDGKTYTFHLRNDVTFSDGTKFNAEAVQTNLQHMRDPATKSPLAAAYIEPYTSGRVVDEYTFEATLREPYSPFLDVLAQSWLGMISPKQIRENPKSIAEHPIGSGPFTVERYVREQGISFVKRADYHWAPPIVRHEGAAYLDRIELSFVPEAMIRYSALLSQQQDLTLDAPAQNAQAIRADPQLVLRSRVRKGNPFRSLTFNVERFPFDDVRVRKALARGFDRKGLAWITGFGEYQVKTDFLAANSRYYDPSFKDALEFNVDAANQLFDDAGWTQRDAGGFRVKNGRRLAATLILTENPQFPSSIGVALQSDAKRLGFDLTIELMPAAQATDLRYTGNFQAIAGGYWHTNTPDGLYILYHSKSITTPQLIGQNTSRLHDPELDDILSRARHGTNPDQLKDLYKRAQQRLTELVPAVPSYESQVLVAYRDYVKGVVFDTSHNTVFFTSLWLDEKRS